MSVLPVYDTDTVEIARRLDRLPDVVAELAAAAAGHDLDGSYPIEGIATVHRAGLLTATVATRYGGPGAVPVVTQEQWLLPAEAAVALRLVREKAPRRKPKRRRF